MWSVWGLKIGSKKKHHWRKTEKGTRDSFEQIQYIIWKQRLKKKTFKNSLMALVCNKVQKYLHDVFYLVLSSHRFQTIYKQFWEKWF